MTTDGQNLEHWHRRSSREVKGARRPTVNGNKTSPRIISSFSEEDFQKLTEVARKQKLPVAAIIRKAVNLYLVHHA